MHLVRMLFFILFNPAKMMGPQEARSAPNIIAWGGRVGGQRLELTSQAHILTAGHIASPRRWWRMLVKRRAPWRNGKMDWNASAWTGGGSRGGGKWASLAVGAARVLGLRESFYAACMSASLTEWSSDSRQLCSFRLSLAAGLCPLPRSSFNRCQGLSGSKQ